jgi:hypothetical protein
MVLGRGNKSLILHSPRGQIGWIIMNKETIFKSEDRTMYKNITSLYKQVIKALKKEGIATNRLVVMNFDYYNKESVSVLNGATSFNRKLFETLITADTVELELTYKEGFLTLTTMLNGYYDDVMGQYVSLWEVGLVKRG